MYNALYLYYVLVNNYFPIDELVYGEILCTYYTLCQDKNLYPVFQNVA